MTKNILIFLRRASYRQIIINSYLILFVILITYLVIDAANNDRGIEALILVLIVTMPILALIALYPVLGAITLLAFAFINPSLLPIPWEIGEFSIRFNDLFLALLLGGIIVRNSITRRLTVSSEFFPFIQPMVPFLLYVGLSLGMVWLYSPDFLLASTASYMRLLMTLAYGLVIDLSVRNDQDLRLLQKWLIGFGLASVGIGLWETFSGWSLNIEGPKVQRLRIWDTRVQGFLGTNSLGLVSGILVMYASILSRRGYSIASWGSPLLIGLVGLFLTKSISSTIATLGAVTFYRLLTKHQNPWGFPFKWIMTGLFVIGGAIVLVWFLRPADVVGLIELSGGSFVQRLMIAYGGLLIFLKHPLTGIGWQASTTPTIIGSPEFNAILMEKFSSLPAYYFFVGKTGSLHNMYIQILAELGLIGVTLFTYLILRIGRKITQILQEVPMQSPYRTLAELAAFGLLFLLIWWNTNPLFGGQTETILASSFLGILAAISRLNLLMKRQL